MSAEKEKKGYWIEYAPNGEAYYCHKVKCSNKKSVIKRTLRELTEILTENKEAQKNI